jgi:arylsulfatase A-like enzyme
MKRRDFLKSSAAAVSGGSIFAGLGEGGTQSGGGRPIKGDRPNILMIWVDELRYPTVFPGKIKTPDEYFAKFMPNVHSLWKRGVKFGNYHTAANACTPSRGTMITGLYSHQHWLCTTILSPPYPTAGQVLLQPVLNSHWPTFGKLLRRAGYSTPYIGKWHVSIPVQKTGGLEAYGFDFQTYPDPTGNNLQGTYGDESRGYHNDAYSAGQAVNWLSDRKSSDKPWCLTVSLVNPHDREFFPAGTEYRTTNELFASGRTNPEGYDPLVKYPGDGPVVPWRKNALKSPPSYGYPAVPPNWEKDLSDKPTTQEFIRKFSAGVWGGIAFDESQDYATVEKYPQPDGKDDNLGMIQMPFSYWQRGMDSYTQVSQIVDAQIGRVLDALNCLPESVVENTVIVFAADHGEYNGAHGIVQGKLGSVYEEAWHIPLIVVDPSGRFTGQTHQIRNGLVSSVDLSTMLVSLGYMGTRDWMVGPLADMYGGRHDVISMLKSANSPGRPYVLYATDEIAPNYYNFNSAPTHVLGLRTDDTKLGVYEDWVRLSSNVVPGSVQKEFYDHDTRKGALEIANTVNHDPRAEAMYQTLVNDLVPNELQAPLPGPYGVLEKGAKIAHLLYREVMANKPDGDWQKGDLKKVLGYGEMF